MCTEGLGWHNCCGRSRRPPPPLAGLGWGGAASSVPRQTRDHGQSINTTHPFVNPRRTSPGTVVGNVGRGSPFSTEAAGRPEVSWELAGTTSGSALSLSGSRDHRASSQPLCLTSRTPARLPPEIPPGQASVPLAYAVPSELLLWHESWVLANRAGSFWDICPSPVHSIGSARLCSPLRMGLCDPTPHSPNSVDTMATCTTAIKARSLSRPRANRHGPWGLGPSRRACTVLAGGLDLREGHHRSPGARGAGPWPLRRVTRLCRDSGQHPPQKPPHSCLGSSSCHGD